MKPYVIGITGRSGSGKTTLVDLLLNNCGPDHLSVLSLDDYYKPRKEQKLDDEGYFNFDLPESFDLIKLHSNLISLLSGEDISIPSYIYNSAERLEDKKIVSRSVILLEGLFINYLPKINDLIDYNVFISSDKETSYNRRLSRDIHERNYQQIEIEHRFFSHAEPAYVQHIKNNQALADCVLTSSMTFTDDPTFYELVTHINGYIKK